MNRRDVLYPPRQNPPRDPRLLTRPDPDNPLGELLHVHADGRLHIRRDARKLRAMVRRGDLSPAAELPARMRIVELLPTCRIGELIALTWLLVELWR